MQITLPSKHLPERQLKSCILVLFLTCCYTKVDTVARASTCDSERSPTERRATNTASQTNSPGHPNAALSCQKLVFRRLRTAQVPASTSDRMASLMARSTAHSSAKKTDITHRNTMLYVHLCIRAYVRKTYHREITH